MRAFVRMSVYDNDIIDQFGHTPKRLTSSVVPAVDNDALEMARGY